jgi:hypothetical protein
MGSEKAGQRVMKSVSDFITRRLQLKVHESKSAVDRLSRRKFLGFTIAEGAKPQRRIAPQALKRFREKVRELTRRTRGVDGKRMVSDLTVYLRGWVGYFGFCETPWELRDLDGWIRRRLRAVAWKQWKRGPTRCRELMRRPRPWNRNDSALHSVVIKAASLRDTKPFIQSVLCHRMQPLSIPSGRVETWRGDDRSFRFHVPLIEPDGRISPGAPGLSDKNSCVRPREVAGQRLEPHQSQRSIKVLIRKS